MGLEGDLVSHERTGLKRLPNALNLTFLFAGLIFLVPTWLLKVHWGQEQVALQLLPWLAGPSIAVQASVGKGLLVALTGVVGLGLGALIRVLRHDPKATGFEPSVLAKILAFLFVLTGIVCLEPYPLYLKPNGKPSFDIVRNLFVSLGPVFRSAGLVMLVVGIGGQGRRTLARAWDAFFQRLTTTSLKKSLWIVGAAGFVLAFFVGQVAFLLMPTLRDEAAALFQASIFAHGAVSLKAPPWVDFMDVSCIITSPAWSSMYPPGWSAFLAVGRIVGAPWLIGFLMAGLCCVMVFLLLRREVDVEAAWVGTLLLLSSPFFLRLAGSYMSHVSALALVSAFLYLSLHRANHSNPLLGVLAGLSIALATTIRPLPAVSMALPVCVLLLKRLLEDWKQIVRFLLPASGAAALVILAWLAYNAHTTGSWFLTGYHARLGEVGEMGFGARIMGEHTVLLGFLHDLGRLFRLSEQGIGIPFAGALLLGIGIYLTPWNTNRRVLFAGFLLVWATSGIYWWYEHWFGPRYIFEGLPGFLLVASIGIARLLRAPGLGQWVRTGLLVGFVWAFAALLPEELHKLRQGYGEVDRHTVHQLRDPDLTGSAIMIEDSDMNAWPHDTYTSAFLAMVLDEFQGATMVRDMGEMNAKLDSLLPGVEWYYYRHGDRTGEGYLERIEGPMPRQRSNP
jgi:hypothetical protein